MNDQLLLNYRANPTNRTFSEVHRAYQPWLRANGMWTLRQFPTLSPEGELDDLTNEGLLAISRSARRFVFFCATCGRAFVQASDLSAHAAEDHRVRGSAANVSLVSLGKFAEVSAKLAMKRTAARMLTPEIPEEDVDPGGAWVTEEQILTELLIRRAATRLTADARRVLVSVLEADHPRVLTSDVVYELQVELLEL